MQRYPLKELKSFYNEFICKKGVINDHCQVNSFSQFQIIKYLIENKDDDIYQKDFENVLKIRKSTVSGILNTMEKNNIIRRLHSEADARGKIIKLTDEALEFHKKMEKGFDDLNLKLTNGITKADLDTFYEVLDKMKNNLQQEDI